MFTKGKSGNPGGRPKGFADFRAACQGRTERTLEVLDDAIGQGPTPLAIEAAKVLLSYAWGKPTQVIEADLNVNHSIPQLLDEARRRLKGD